MELPILITGKIGYYPSPHSAVLVGRIIIGLISLIIDYLVRAESRHDLEVLDVHRAT